MALNPRQKNSIWNAYRSARMEKEPEVLLLEIFQLLLESKATQNSFLRSMVQANRDAEQAAKLRLDQDRLDQEAALDDSIAVKESILTGTDI